MRELLETGITATQAGCFIFDACAIYFMIFKGLPLLAEGVRLKIFSSFFLKAGRIIVYPFHLIFGGKNNGN